MTSKRKAAAMMGSSYCMRVANSKICEGWSGKPRGNTERAGNELKGELWNHFLLNWKSQL